MRFVKAEWRLKRLCSAEELNALVAALGSGFLFCLGNLVTQELGVFDVAQTLEAWRAVGVQSIALGRSPFSGSKKRIGLVAVRGRLWSMAVSDSTPGQ